VARGVQNKILEAMAMARPAVISTACAAGIDATAGRDYEDAADAQGFVAAIEALLREPDRAASMGQAARNCVLASYSWDAHLSRIDRYLNVPANGQVHAA
jgi:glycosyltransferase involved in cell wall biosynthesis